uniref:Sugar efflux transporter for intercellular exchange n=1 Tax=Candidatus Kentrum sp. MB TaxID=2138164 RepID=A0A451BCW2_9GAMM|nr:MAG: Sugar efflux transporter for intercellular exchange [Candidatus Kentron sp. MB]VFK33260.1 MAG: Sugar efflux transporter for intercellular exchange [Candidatus Kentron sp. MB]VFK76119.1 MAG: Sugar efflux transporter for intercellular exchange [Candidatus Kentron sp. MB]
MNGNVVDKVGWVASVMAMLMFSSYLDQIRLNLNGNPGSVILPIVTTLNCVTWTFYALFKPEKDWPLFSCNTLSAMIGFVTAMTAIFA